MFLSLLPQAAEHMQHTIPHADLVRITRARHTGLIEAGRQYSDAIAAGVERPMSQGWSATLAEAPAEAPEAPHL